MSIDIERDLLDTDGENRAVRSFLMQYGLPGLTVGAMLQHMDRSGWGSDYCPAFVNGSTANSGEHLTKAGAQIWIRHLFSLEARATPQAPTPAAATQELRQARRSIAAIKGIIAESSDKKALALLLDDDIESIEKYLATPSAPLPRQAAVQGVPDQTKSAPATTGKDAP